VAPPHGTLHDPLYLVDLMHGSLQKILPTSGRTAYDPLATVRHKESSWLEYRRAAAWKSKPRELTVDPVDDHDESGAEI
jgi:hypothetical protein